MLISWEVYYDHYKDPSLFLLRWKVLHAYAALAVITIVVASVYCFSYTRHSLRALFIGQQLIEASQQFCVIFIIMIPFLLMRKLRLTEQK